MSVEATLEPTVAASAPANGVFANRFLLVAVAAQRVLQVRSGSRPRVDAGTHKPAVVAVAEVLAGCVPYFSS